MISTELLRRYPFFAFATPEQLRELAMITREQEYAGETHLFDAGAKADTLYLLRSGAVELHFVVVDERGMETPQDYLVGMINPGEVFGVSALIEPYTYTATAVASEPSHVLELNAVALRALAQADSDLAARLLQRVAAVTLQRLQDTRVQLLAA